MFTSLEAVLISFSNVLSVPWFVFVASIIEEIVAPIPSPTVMVIAGSVASVQSYGTEGLLFLACIGAMGKTLGAIVVYTIAHRAEDLVLNRFGKFFGVTSPDVERFGTKIGTGFRGYCTLTLFRALPIVPSVLVSVGSGILKVPMSIFIVSAFFGTIIRDGFYLYVGYVGTDSLRFLVTQSTNIETIIEYVGIGGIIVGGIYLVYRFRNKFNNSEC